VTAPQKKKFKRHGCREKDEKGRDQGIFNRRLEIRRGEYTDSCGDILEVQEIFGAEEDAEEQGAQNNFQRLPICHPEH